MDRRSCRRRDRRADGERDRPTRVGSDGGAGAGGAADPRRRSAWCERGGCSRTSGSPRCSRHPTNASPDPRRDTDQTAGRDVGAPAPDCARGRALGASSVVHRLREAGCVDAERRGRRVPGRRAGRRHARGLAAPSGAGRARGVDRRLGRRSAGADSASRPASTCPGRTPRSWPGAPRHDCRAGGRAVDLCTGTGAIAARPAARRVRRPASSASTSTRAAARCARGNGVPSVVGDLADPIAGDGALGPGDRGRALRPDRRSSGCSRPTCSATSRAIALDGGADGLDLVRRIVDAAARLLRPGGWLVARARRRPGRTLVRPVARRPGLRRRRALARRGRRPAGDRGAAALEVLGALEVR